MGTGAKTKGRPAGGDVAHVALLRGINVGGKNELPMRELAAIFTHAGCNEVRTHIQVGNGVFRARPPLAKRAGALVTKHILARFGSRTPVVMRTASDLRRVTERNPFLGPDVDPRILRVVFLARKPSSVRVAELDPDPDHSPNASPRGIRARIVGRGP